MMQIKNTQVMHIVSRLRKDLHYYCYFIILIES